MTEFETYFRRYYTPLSRYVLRICHDPVEAEDIVQETFSTAWQKFSGSTLPVHFKSYLFRMAHNIAIDRLRASAPTETLEALEAATPIMAPEALEPDTAERDAALWRAIGRLPQRCRQVFLLSKRDGLSNAQIAEELSISVKTVENQMTKAFKALRSNLRRNIAVAAVAIAVAAMAALTVYYIVSSKAPEEPAPAPVEIPVEVPAVSPVSKKIEFRDASLLQVVAEIERLYGVKIADIPQEEIRVSISYEGTAEDVVATLNDLFDTRLQIVAE